MAMVRTNSEIAYTPPHLCYLFNMVKYIYIGIGCIPLQNFEKWIWIRCLSMHLHTKVNKGTRVVSEFRIVVPPNEKKKHTQTIRDHLHFGIETQTYIQHLYNPVDG